MPTGASKKRFSTAWVMGVTAMAAVMVSGIAACASAPNLPRSDEAAAPPQRAPSAALVALQVSVQSPAGPLNQAQRIRAVEQAAAQGRAAATKRQLEAMASFGTVDLYSGNEARLLVDGPVTFAAMFEAIGAARHSILLESYIIEDAAVAQQLATLLAEKRKQGVAVFVIYDAVGSLGTQQAYFDALHQAGIATCAFNPVNPLKRPGYFDISHRDHRKILTVDRRIGFTGGINISAVYTSGSFGKQRATSTAADAHEAGWRDTQLQLRGPAVAALDDLVRETWLQQGCKAENSQQAALPERPADPPGAGQQLMRIIPSSPDDRLNRIYALLLSAVNAAEHSIYLTMAYFAPGQEMVEALATAARRGVDVQLVLPSRSDFAPVLHAGRSHYEHLLGAGVKIHELQDAVLHAKTAVIDGVVSTVGSSNMDWRSFTANNEVNAVVIGEDFGAAMTRMFRQDLAASKAVTLAQWRDRSWWQRAKEQLARLLERWW